MLKLDADSPKSKRTVVLALAVPPVAPLNALNTAAAMAVVSVAAVITKALPRYTSRLAATSVGAGVTAVLIIEPARSLEPQSWVNMLDHVATMIWLALAPTWNCWVPTVPSNSVAPLNSGACEMRSSSDTRWPASC